MCLSTSQHPITLLQWHITSADPPGVMFFCDKYLHNGNSHLHVLCAGEAPDEKLKIGALFQSRVDLSWLKYTLTNDDSKILILYQF